MLFCPLCRIALGPTQPNCPRDGQTGVDLQVDPIPEELAGRFTVVEAFARGNSGSLFLVDEPATGRRGLLKILHADGGPNAPDRQRLVRELVKQATLINPHLVSPLATGEARGVPWIFREWIEGVSLAARLSRSGALPTQEALAIAAQLATALDELHRAGLLHRDLKPGHVIVQPQATGAPRVSVIDAGVAGRLATSSVFDVLGTAAYVSPEQTTGKLVSFRSDLYSLGCLLYEMLNGTPPFTGSDSEVIAAHAAKPIPPLNVQIPQGVQSLVESLLAKEPRERPFSAQQVRRALDPFVPEQTGSREVSAAFDTNDATRVSAPPVAAVRAQTQNRTMMGMPQVIPPPTNPGASIATNPGASLGSNPGASIATNPGAPGGKVRAMGTIMGMPAAPTAQRASQPPPPPPEALRQSRPPEGGRVSQPPPVPEGARRTSRPPPPPNRVSQPPPLPASGRPGLEYDDLSDTNASGAHQQQQFGQSRTMDANAGHANFEAHTTVDSPPTSFTTAPEAYAGGIPPAALGSSPGTFAAPAQTGSSPGAYAAPEQQAWQQQQPAAPQGAWGAQPQQPAFGQSATSTAPGGWGGDPAAAQQAAWAGAPGAAGPSGYPAATSMPAPAPQQKKGSPVAIILVILVILLGAGGAAGFILFKDQLPAWATFGQHSTEPVATSPSPSPVPSLPVPSPAPSQPLAATADTNAQPTDPNAAPTPTAATPTNEQPPVADTNTAPAPVQAEEAAPAPAAHATESPERSSSSRRRDRHAAATPTPAATATTAAAPAADPATALRNQARDHFQARRFAEAAAAYERAAALNPNNAGTFAGLGAARLAMNDARGAIRAYEKATQLQPSSSGFHSALGRAYFMAGDRAHAGAEFQRALSLDPNNAAAREGMARVQ